MLLISFVVFALVIFGPASVGPSPITHGELVYDISKYPYTAALRKDNQFLCAAAIIRPNIALTSAHCANKLTGEGLTLTAGGLERDGTENSCFQSRQIEKVVIHPRYGMDDVHDFDIAKVILDCNLEINQWVNVINIGDRDYTGHIVKLVGWGVDEDQRKVPTLVTGTATVQLHDICTSEFPKKMTDRMGCADSSIVHQVACHDSGSLVVYNKTTDPEDHILVGIGSYTEILENGMCDIYKPFLYSQIDVHHDWIVCST